MADSNVKPVVISYADLCNPDADLKAKIEEGFGFAGLGLILVSGIPNLVELREKLLPLGSVLASKPAEVKAKLELADTAYSVGWSHGKEKLKEGVFGMSPIRPKKLLFGCFLSNGGELELTQWCCGCKIERRQQRVILCQPTI